MKRIISFVIGILAVAIISSCSKIEGEGWIVDWAPVSITLRVYDANGINLLDPSIENSWAESVIITFQGKTYKSLVTKAIKPYMYGLVCVDRGEGYQLTFGEIDGSADMDEDLVISWPDGTSNTIHYHCAKHDERKGTCERWYVIDGIKENDGLPYLNLGFTK